jgi:hypothetical protein
VRNIKLIQRYDEKGYVRREGERRYRVHDISRETGSMSFQDLIDSRGFINGRINGDSGDARNVEEGNERGFEEVHGAKARVATDATGGTRG